MIKLKPSNIFDYYAPPGGTAKIADFSMQLKSKEISIIPELAAPVLNGVAETANTSAISKTRDNKWVYYMIGGVVVVGGIYLIYSQYKEKEEQENKSKRFN